MITFDKRLIRTLSLLGPSGAYGAAASEISENNEKAVFLTADLCFFSGLEKYKKTYPERLYNFGIAEQNMLGAAAGFAKEGFIPFVSTYASFCCSRCADQARVCMSYMNLPIKLVGLTAGYGAGILGATHMSVEDISVFRALPNVVVISPADCTEIIKALVATSENDNPTYIRLTGPMNTPVVYKEDYEFKIGKAVHLKEGDEICLLATGSMVYNSLKAAEILEKNNLSCSVINIHTLKPLDIECVLEASRKHKIIACVEEHNVIGGLFSAVSEVLVQEKIRPPVIPIGIRDKFVPPGEYGYQLEMSGLTPDQIAMQIMSQYKHEKP